MMEMKSYIHMIQNENTPVVDIVMLAYNHAEFIEDALKGVFMQRTKYSYRLIIGEDCSTDTTRQIILDYYKQYPDKMELCLWKENVGAFKNLIELIVRCRGEYIILLEGDDYWTDPLKLEKQVSLLEEHPEYIGTAHNVRCVDRNKNLLHCEFGLYPILEEHIYGKKQAEKLELVAQTASLLYRNIWRDWTKKELEKFFRTPGNGDLKISVFLGILGDIYYFKDIMADHRRVFEGDSWTAKAHNRNMLWFNYMTYCTMQDIMEHYGKFRLNIENKLIYIYEESCLRLLCSWNKENLSTCWKFLKRKLRGTYGQEKITVDMEKFW